jgi:hypothetical protein
MVEPGGSVVVVVGATVVVGAVDVVVLELVGSSSPGVVPVEVLVES